MALKLVDIAADLDIGRQRTYIEMFAESTDLLSAIPVENVPNGRAEYQRPVDLGTPGRRSINEAYAESTGRTETVQFYTKLIGADVDVDKALVRRAGDSGPSVRARTEMMMAKAIAHQLDNDILTGDEGADPEEFNGITTIVAGTAQEHANGGSAAAMGIKNLQESILMCEGATHILMQRSQILNLDASTRATGVSGYLNYSRDQFGVLRYEFAGLPILVADPTGHNNPALTGYSEASSTTSVYVLNLSGDSNSVRLIQMAPMEVSDLGEIDTKPVLRTRIEWDVGLAIPNPRGVVRLKNITNATAVA